MNPKKVKGNVLANLTGHRENIFSVWSFLLNVTNLFKYSSIIQKKFLR